MVVFTIRNLGGIALLLAGSTWLWVTPAFASRGVTTSGVLWGAARVLSLLTIVGFCLATWGLFARDGWWESAALLSAVVGLVALVPYGIAALQGGETAGTTAWNVFVHVVMLAGIFLLLLVPPLERWVDGHVMGG
jgi:cell shape-determining protein MreD